MSSAIIPAELNISPGEVFDLIVLPSGGSSLPVQAADRVELESPVVERRGFITWCRILSSILVGYLASAVIHSLVLVLLAIWIFHEEPRHSEPLTLAAQTMGIEARPELMAASAPAASAVGGTSTQPMIFTTDLPLEMTGPKLATGLEKAKGTSAGVAVDVAAKIGGTGPVGTQVNFFGTEATGNSFVFVLDASGSMNDGNRYGRATTELLKALDALTAEQQFCVIAFNGRTWPMLNSSFEQTMLLPATDENKAQLKYWLEGLRPFGWTDPRDAMALALKLAPSAIFFLSDGEFKQGQKKLGYETLSKVNRANRDHIPIHALAFEDQANAATLRGMAKASGGTYRFVPAEK